MPGSDAVACADAREWLRTLSDASVDFVLTDPPYPGVRRHYGYWTPDEWAALIDDVTAQCRRVLKPSGSAVFVLQPNAERVGAMRTWLWEFMARWGAAWNIVQDVWWWHPASMPTIHSQARIGLLRPSLKACVWLGSPDCFRDQSRVLWTTTDQARAMREVARSKGRRSGPSGASVDQAKSQRRAAETGEVSPFNVLPIVNTQSTGDVAGAFGHGAGTPRELCAWWVRYACPPGGLVVDPFAGTGTVGVAALADGKRFAGCEVLPEFAAVARERIAAGATPTEDPRQLSLLARAEVSDAAG